jgi:hypothetical protein
MKALIVLAVCAVGVVIASLGGSAPSVAYPGEHIGVHLVSLQKQTAGEAVSRATAPKILQ